MKQCSETKRKRGNKVGFWIFETVYKIFGLNVCYLFLYLVVPYYLLFDRRAVLSVMPYIEKKFPVSGFIAIYKHIYLIFLNLGRQLINRYVYLSNKELFNITSKGLSKLLSLCDSRDKGCIMLTSHIGNWQLATEKLQSLEQKVNIVMRLEENLAVKESLQLYSDKGNIKIITPTIENLGGVLEITNALKQGEVVVMAGDRSYGADTVAVDFLGETAFFPYGAFKIAECIDCPIAVLLIHQKKQTEYTLNLNNILFSKNSGKKSESKQFRSCVQEYADILATFIEEHPYDYFIFYDIWKK
jgi:predicted LPLAT superfamily acyltransferase